MKKKYLAKLLTLSLFSLGLLSCSSTPEIYKPTELDSVKELKTGQAIIYCSSDENLATFLKQRLEIEIPIVNGTYHAQIPPVTFYIIPTYQDWKRYYNFKDNVVGMAISRSGTCEIFALAIDQYKLVGDQYRDKYIANVGIYVTDTYELYVKNIAAKQQTQ